MKTKQIFTVVLPILFFIMAFLGGGWNSFPRNVGIVVAAGVALLVSITKHNSLNFKKLYLFSWLSFLILCIISIFFTISLNKTVEEVIIYFSYFFMFIFILNIDIDNFDTIKFLRLFLIGSAIIIGIGYYFFLQPRLGGIEITHNMLNYFIGTFYWKNPMAGYIIMILPLTLALIVIDRTWWRIFYVIFFIAAGQALLLTHSRGAWVAFIPVLLLFFILAFKYIKGFSWLFIGLAFLLAVVITPLFAPPKQLVEKAETISHVADDIEQQEQSYAERKIMYTVGLKIIRDFPVLGVGLNAYSSIYPKYIEMWRYISKYLHNQYIQITVEMGILGLILFLFLLISVLLKQFLGILKHKNMNRVLLTGLFCAQIAVTLHIAVDFDWAFPAIVFPFWAFSAIAINIGTEREYLKPEKNIIQKIIFVAIPVIILFFSITRYYANTYYQLGNEELNSGYIENAFENFEVAVDLNPFDGEYQYSMANINNALGDTDKYKEYLEKAIAREPYSSDFHYLLGEFYRQNGNTAEAINELKKAIELAPRTRPNHYNSFASLYYTMNEPEKALDYYEEVTRKFSSNPHEWYTKATAAHRYQVGEAYLQIAKIKEELGDTVGLDSLRKVGIILSTPRIVDKIAQIFDHHIESPEKVVADFWDYLSKEDSAAAVGLVYEEVTTWKPTWSKAEVTRIKDIQYDYLNGTARVSFVLNLQYPSGEVKQEDRAMRLTLTEGGWKISIF
ncbi:O-antigen ligase family protein [bacterium]|nr:O-antigen ligase family protein [bacterium]